MKPMNRMPDELSPASRALLDAARGGLGPDAAAIRRMRTGVAVAVGATAVVSSGQAAAASIGAGGGALSLKLGGLAVVLAVALGVSASRSRGPVTVSPAIELAPVTEPVVAGATHVTVTEQAAVAPAPALVAAPARSTRPSPVGSAPVELAREVELIDGAMAALRRGDARAAIEAVRRHRRETHGRGQLDEDAAAIEIEAACRQADPGAAAKLDAFDARYPQSAQRARLGAACR